MIQPPLNFSFPLLDDQGKATDTFRSWIIKASLSIPMTGAGSPEGVLEAPQYQLYLDTTAAAGSIAYRKMLPDIGGDVTQGWKLQ